MFEKRELEELFKEILEAAFGQDRIGDVRVVQTCDGDGDNILRVFAEFNGTSDELDADIASSMVRRFRSRLFQQNDVFKEHEMNVYPIISYLSREEMRMVRDEIG